MVNRRIHGVTLYMTMSSLYRDEGKINCCWYHFRSLGAS